MTSKSILAALQDFKTSFELAKVSAPISSAASSSKHSDINTNKRKDPPALEVSDLLQGYLQEVSKSGVTGQPWKVVKPLFLCKLDEVIRWYNIKQPLDNLPTLPNSREQTFKQLYTRLVRAADAFKQAPFTVQRLCELLCFPEQHYKRIDKFLYALEKNITVVTTVDEESRKICTSSEMDLKGADTQQADKVLALFDWIHSTDCSDDTSSTNSASDLKESHSLQPSSSAEPISSDQSITKSAPAAISSSQSNHVTSPLSLNGDATLTVQSGPRSLKRSWSDDKQSLELPYEVKRVKVDTTGCEAEKVETDVSAADSTTSVSISPSTSVKTTTESEANVAADVGTEANVDGTEASGKSDGATVGSVESAGTAAQCIDVHMKSADVSTAAHDVVTAAADVGTTAADVGTTAPDVVTATADVVTAAPDMGTAAAETAANELSSSSDSASVAEEVTPSSSNEDNTSQDGDSIDDSEGTEAASQPDLPADIVKSAAGSFKDNATAPTNDVKLLTTSDIQCTPSTNNDKIVDDRSPADIDVSTSATATETADKVTADDDKAAVTEAPTSSGAETNGIDNGTEGKTVQANAGPTTSPEDSSKLETESTEKMETTTA